MAKAGSRLEAVRHPPAGGSIKGRQRQGQGQRKVGSHVGGRDSTAKLRNRQYHREPLSRALGDGLFELRHVGTLNTRVLWFFMKGRRIIAVHGIRNKSQAIPARDLATARERMDDWLSRA
jgi:phage-related protein